MKLKNYNFLILAFVILITGCSFGNEENNITGKNLLYLDSSSESVIISKDMSILADSQSVANSSTPFTQVKAFIPNEKYTQYMEVQGENFLYIKVPKNDSIISGELVFENNSKETILTQTLFLQGNKNVKIKPSNTKKWVPAINYSVQPYSSVKIKIDIQWDLNGMQELTFFPIDKTSKGNRYNGGNLSNYRFFVQSKDMTIGKDLLEKQSFKLNESELNSNLNLVPFPSWINKENKEIDVITENDITLTNEKISGIKLEEIPYNTEFDVVFIDEFGNSTLLAENVKAQKKKSTFVQFDTTAINEMYSINGRGFIVVFNNRDKEIMADLRSLDTMQKPFFTSYQGILELFDYKK